MTNKEFITIAELAKMLGISRIAVFNKVKKGQIQAVRIGRSYAIPAQNIAHILGETLTDKQRNLIEKAVAKTVKEYIDTLKLLFKE